MGAEILGVLAIGVMGKDNYSFLKQRVVGLIKPYAPLKTVSRKRYLFGLFLFILPILFGWLSVYTAKIIPGFTNYPLIYTLGGDLMLLASLYILGGDFGIKSVACSFMTPRCIFLSECIHDFKAARANL